MERFFFSQQEVGTVVCLKLLKHINVVHIVKVGRSYDHCVIFHTICSNNKSAGLNSAEVRPWEGVFGNYIIRDIRNNPICVLAAGFQE